ncbi:hypothetical protein AMECASPLE_014157 [Ameca splendens]|uniref:Uncharacterized protein n=1 Tax=Ameca splendens TaxID=208324 RepID=A0ABV0ZN58_9TELE
MAPSDGEAELICCVGITGIKGHYHTRDEEGEYTCQCGAESGSDAARTRMRVTYETIQCGDFFSPSSLLSDSPHAVVKIELCADKLDARFESTQSPRSQVHPTTFCSLILIISIL